MAIVDRIFVITIMALILAFSIIHLGVSIGIIVPYHKYGDIFKPQIGLSGFNIVISAFGLVTGILGLISILMNSEQLGKIYFNRKKILVCQLKMILVFYSIFVIYSFSK